jgi:hypothetical protein
MWSHLRSQTLSQFLSCRSPVQIQQWPQYNKHCTHVPPVLNAPLLSQRASLQPDDALLPSPRTHAHAHAHTHTHTAHTVFARSRCCWFVAPTRTTQMHSTPKRTPNRRAAGQPSRRCNTPGRLFVPTSSAMARVRRGAEGGGRDGSGGGQKGQEQPETHTRQNHWPS